MHRSNVSVQGFFSGGAGFVLSKETLRRFTQIGLKKSSLCREDDGGDEDVNMGEENKEHVFKTYILLLQGACMKRLNVTQGDSRDEKQRKRFFPFLPQDHLIPSMQPRYGCKKMYHAYSYCRVW